MAAMWPPRWQLLAKDILNGSQPAVYFSVPGSPFHSENSKLPAYDLAAAQKDIDAYVAEKGGPVKFTMLVFQQQLDQDMPQKTWPKAVVCRKHVANPQREGQAQLMERRRLMEPLVIPMMLHNSPRECRQILVSVLHI